MNSIMQLAIFPTRQNHMYKITTIHEDNVTCNDYVKQRKNEWKLSLIHPQSLIFVHNLALYPTLNKQPNNHKKQSDIQLRTNIQKKYCVPIS